MLNHFWHWLLIMARGNGEGIVFERKCSRTPLNKSQKLRTPNHLQIIYFLETSPSQYQIYRFYHSELQQNSGAEITSNETESDFLYSIAALEALISDLTWVSMLNKTNNVWAGLLDAGLN